MAGVILNGSTSGSVTLDPPAVAGSTVITLPATSGTMALTGGAVSGTTGTFTDEVTMPVLGVNTDTATTGTRFIVNGSNNYDAGMRISSGGTTVANIGTKAMFVSGATDEFGIWANGTSQTLILGTNGADRVRINNIGQISANTTSPVSAGWLTLNYDGQNYNGLMVRTTTSGTYYGAMFKNVSDAFVGNISVSASATAYNTSSDYRLKDNVAPMTGALARVALLKPVTYSWKIDGSAGEGFIAHELQEVCPLAVTGEKDAVNEDGSVKSQSIDVSFLVATLTAAIQEQQALIENLTTRLSALENK